MSTWIFIIKIIMVYILFKVFMMHFVFNVQTINTLFKMKVWIVLYEDLNCRECPKGCYACRNMTKNEF